MSVSALNHFPTPKIKYDHCKYLHPLGVIQVCQGVTSSTALGFPDLIFIRRCKLLDASDLVGVENFYLLAWQTLSYHFKIITNILEQLCEEYTVIKPKYFPKNLQFIFRLWFCISDEFFRRHILRVSVEIFMFC